MTDGTIAMPSFRRKEATDITGRQMNVEGPLLAAAVHEAGHACAHILSHDRIRFIEIAED